MPILSPLLNVKEKSRIVGRIVALSSGLEFAAEFPPAPGFSLGAVPVPAHKAVGLVPVDHVFRGLDGDDASQDSGVDGGFEKPEEGRVAQDMADDHAPPRFLLHPDQFLKLLQVRRDGLFEKDVVAFF